MHDRMALLFANEAFYAAFAGHDYAAMEALWARHAPVACIHPGWGVLEGREWRLVHHQAGPTREQPDEEDEDDPSRPRAMQ